VIFCIAVEPCEIIFLQISFSINSYVGNWYVNATIAIGLTLWQWYCHMIYRCGTHSIYNLKHNWVHRWEVQMQ
jgi:hypothetical protein